MASALSTQEASEQRIVLQNIDWETYERILDSHKDESVPRFTYDRGRLEIVSPSSEHEKLKHTVTIFVEVVAEEMNVDVEGLGSTTFRREDLVGGFEPDSCFYIENAERMRAKTEIDLHVDPPPDLIIEIDITSPSVNKFPLFAQLGVPEVWLCDGGRWKILALAGDEFAERRESVSLPGVTGEVIERFVEESRTLKRPEWLRRVREWARGRR